MAERKMTEEGKNQIWLCWMWSIKHWTVQIKQLIARS